MASATPVQATGGAADGAGGERINYVVDAEKCHAFLDEYNFEDSPGHRAFKYKDMLQEIANRKRNVLEISLDDMLGFVEDGFLDRVQTNAQRYVEMFAAQADKLMPEPTDPAVVRAQAGHVRGESVQEVYRALRLQRMVQAGQDNDAGSDPANGAADGDGADAAGPTHGIPPELMRRFQVVLTPPSKVTPVSLRDVSADQIGNLVRIKGIVTRVADVKPRAVVVSYICDKCGCELYQSVRNKSQFTPLQECSTPQCNGLRKRDRGRVHPSVRGSKFEKFQEIKIQETPDQVPVGHIPRTLSVHCRGSSTRQCSPGDVVEVVGIFLPLALDGFRQMKQGLVATTYLSCMQIKRDKKNYAELGNQLTPEVEEEIDEIYMDENRYSKLARSIAPEIYGLEDVKKALLLQLVGGVTRKMGDGMSIRGDLNVLLMGDPGVAKSQLLKYISSIAPRGVYTTGKGSSGVGLTACVTRDKTTGEVALEGGALVLADMGICCIDEFDKMEEADRTAIHEVMEQQTVSIAKAGVTTTLNARTSILAAANPLFGRYNKRYSPAENINLPAALLSRFDLLFLLLDTAHMENDTALARHITHVHRFARHPALDFTPIQPSLLRAYISQARRVEPTIPPSLCNSIVEEYVGMRQEDLKDARESGSQSMLTARQLLSILRMAQALARLRFDEQVDNADIQEAIRLIKVSKQQLESDDSAFGGPSRGPTDDLLTRIFSVIRDFCNGQGRQSVKYSDIEPVILAKGFTSEQLEECLTEYESLDVLQLNAARTRINLV